ncbi:MAG TPA: alpha/beta fold hydrolase [Solirubrobacterales bacterium]|nr:alpha/beta fold hydrolase [Solirubrobacterales bacterium]
MNERVQAWRDRGSEEEFRDRRIHVYEQDGDGPLLLLLHGFPSSSYDWRLLLERETDRAVLAPDFLGFGLSEKPRDHTYTLHWQADMVEEMVRRRDGTRDVFFLAHDMGTSVANELMARDIEGALEMDLRGGLLLNGSMIQDAASPTLGQRILRSAVGPLFSRLSSERFFRQQFGSIFSPGHPLTAEEAEDQWELICAGGGRTLNHKTIAYMEERFKHADRWHGALHDWRKPLSLAWGMIDPVATEAVLDAVTALRPSAPVTRFEDLGHYPQIEDPGRVATALQAALAA